MFTGIITGVGRIAAIADLGGSAQHGKRLTIEAPAGYLDDVGLSSVPGVEYIGIWLNVPGLERAIKQSDKLTIRPSFSLPASSTFSMTRLSRWISSGPST